MNKTQLAQAFVAGQHGRCHNAHTDGQTYTLHKSPIAVREGNNIVFHWHGYYTPTTAGHMNSILKALNAGFRVGYASARDTGQTHFVVAV
jgi:hypothetical protein